MILTSRNIRLLTAYFGAVQFLHFIALIRAGILYLYHGNIGFPAPPPANGWPPGAIPFLIAMGITDAILIIISEVFIWTFFTEKSWAPKVGLIALSGSMATALIFAIGTLPSGAWLVHPIGYGILCLLFAPFILLFLELLGRQNAPD